MGTKYSTVTVSGFNSGPPADDGSQTAANQVKWSTIKTKLGDPLNTAIAAIDSKLVTALDFGSRQVSASETTVAGDHMKTVEIAPTVSTSITVSLGDAATMAAGYVVTVKNSSANSQTVGRITAGDKINGVAANFTLPPKGAMTFKVANTASEGYLAEGQSGGFANGETDPTKVVRFEVDGLTTATTRVITIPDANIALANWSTGDVKLTFKTVADATWVMCDDGTIGNASSGGTTRANADTEALFTLLWNNVADAQAAVSTGRGANAAADFAANKTIALTKVLGRALGIGGAGSGLTSRVLGLTTGVETHALSIAELASHTHTAAVFSSNAVANSFESGAGGTQSTGTTNSTGSGTAHQNMQPTSFLNMMIKL